MLSLLYLSHSLIPAGDEMPVVQDIMSVAVRRNLANGITGALVFTGRDFAQVLEGPESQVAQVMGSILLDRRHDNVRILARQDVSTRSFPNWGMAQVASTAEVQGRIDDINRSSNEQDMADAIAALSNWMRAGSSARV
jgi:hypothetical protein